MDKSEIIKKNDVHATTIFIAAASGLLVNALLSALQSAVSLSGILLLFVQLIAFACVIFSNIMTINGFSAVNKACKLSEENENYFLGKKLMIFSIISFVLTIILSLVSWVFALMIKQYSVAQSLSQADLNAVVNLKTILAIILIIARIVEISTPFIFYLWRIHKATPKTDSINNFALLTMIILVVHLVIGILNPIYSVKGGETSFLAGFAIVLLVIKYLVLMLFFITRRKMLSAKNAEKDSEVPPTADENE